MFPGAAGEGSATASTVTATTINPMRLKHATPAGAVLGRTKSPLSTNRGLNGGMRVGLASAAANIPPGATTAADTAADTTAQVLPSPESAIMEESSSSSDSDGSDGSSDGEHAAASASSEPVAPEPEPEPEPESESEAASTNQGVPSTTPDNGVDNSDTNKAAIASPVVIEEQEEDI